MSGATSAGTKPPAGAETAGPLTHDEVKDAADTTRRVEAKVAGKRVRAIPGGGGTTVKVSEKDFREKGGIKHKDVVWDFRKDRFTVPVGTKNGEISQEAAEFLCQTYPLSFEFMGA